jgi:hypothetical protein
MRMLFIVSTFNGLCQRAWCVEQSGSSAWAQLTLDAAVRERLVFWRPHPA